MLRVLKLVFFLSCLVATSVANGIACRKCTAVLRVVFTNGHVTEDKARKFAAAALGGCATGIDLGYHDVSGMDCPNPKVVLCNRWNFGAVSIQHYCADKAKIHLEKLTRCFLGVCGETTLDLSCPTSAACIGKCTPSECGG